MRVFVFSTDFNSGHGSKLPLNLLDIHCAFWFSFWIHSAYSHSETMVRPVAKRLEFSVVRILERFTKYRCHFYCHFWSFALWLECSCQVEPRGGECLLVRFWNWPIKAIRETDPSKLAQPPAHHGVPWSCGPDTCRCNQASSAHDLVTLWLRASHLLPHSWLLSIGPSGAAARYPKSAMLLSTNLRIEDWCPRHQCRFTNPLCPVL